MTKKFFTVAEANALLPAVRADLEALRRVQRQFEEKYYELQERKATSDGHGGQAYGARAAEGPARSGKDGSSAAGGEQGASDTADPFFADEFQLEFLQIEATTLLRSIQMKGGELKDIETGLVDFPALLHGKEVLLCWRYGEDSIRHYHGMNDGFTGRKPLDDAEA